VPLLRTRIAIVTVGRCASRSLNCGRDGNDTDGAARYWLGDDDDVRASVASTIRSMLLSVMIGDTRDDDDDDVDDTNDEVLP
jgi:hypothetical protein